MPTIEVSSRTLTRLQGIAEPLVDTPDTVIGRLLDHYESSQTAPHKGPKRVSQRRFRAPKGAKTPTSAFHDAILEVLSEGGGELPTRDAVDRVGERMWHQLTEVDQAPLQSGEPRWRNSVRWARNELVEQGLLDADAPHGRWRLASREH